MLVLSSYTPCLAAAPNSSSIASSGSESQALTYLREKAWTLRRPGGTYDEWCSNIALQIAARLFKDGKYPSILQFSEADVETGILTFKELKPLLYEGRVSWGFHVVCQCDGLIYDPVLGDPISVQLYSIQMFGENIPRIVLFDTLEIQELIGAEIVKSPEPSL